MDKETFKEMNYLPNNLTFDDGVAFLNDFSLIDIASEHGTPLYLYAVSYTHLRAHET